MNRAERRKDKANGVKRYTMANLVYGAVYPQLWLENQLKSLVDPTNLPALRARGYELDYVVFTDEGTLHNISRHPNFMQLSQLCNINVVKMTWPSDADQFASRYGLLVQMFHQVLPVAIERDSLLSVWVADLVFAKHSIKNMISHMEKGHDGVFMVPIRSAADSLNGLLSQISGAPTDLELFEMAYANLHHLWWASHWDNPMFSKFPYSMVWNSGTGLCTHHFGITPIVFRPNEEMKNVQGVIDADVPAFCKNPYWCEDWTDAAVAGVEPLSNGHYPPFLQHRATIDFCVDWAKRGTMPQQWHNLNKTLYYPCRSIFNNQTLAAESEAIATKIQEGLGLGSDKV